MSSRSQLITASIVAAAAIIALGTPATTNIVVHALAGAIVGFLSYGGMRVWNACGPQQ
jgi:hypothetical protein